MERSKFSEARIAFALRQAEEGATRGEAWSERLQERPRGTNAYVERNITNPPSLPRSRGPSKLVPHPAVERLADAVPPRLARRDEVPCLLGPFEHAFEVNSMP